MLPVLFFLAALRNAGLEMEIVPGILPESASRYGEVFSEEDP